MVDQPFNRTALYPLEKPIVDDINQEFSQADRSIRDVMYQLLGQQSTFLGNSLLVVPSSPTALSVVIKAGIGFQVNATDEVTSIAGVAGLNDLSPYKPIVLGLDYTVAVPAPPGANSRIDLIEVSYQRLLDNSQSREFLNVSGGNFTPANVAKTLDFNVDGTLAYYAANVTPTTALAYKSGVASASPTAPTTDTGYIALAYVLVANSTTVITSTNIVDKRPIAAVGGRFLGRQIITATGIYTPTLGATKCRIKMVGGGGGAGGVAGGATSVAVTGGGASGRYLEQYIDNGGVQLSLGVAVVGTGGAGGAAGNNPGTAGGDTTFTINATTYTAKGGGASTGSSNHDFWIGNPGFIPAGSSATDVVAGEQGYMGMGINGGGLSTSAGIGGNGGSNPLGTGGLGTSNVAGGQGAGYGAGGGGTSNTLAGNDAGGAGTNGVVIIEEWT